MPAKKILCPECKKDIGKSGSIQCRNCSSWFHLPCAGLDDLFVEMSLKYNGVFFVCKDCIDKPHNLSGEMKTLNEKLDCLSQQISNNKDYLNSRLDNVVQDIKTDLISRFAAVEERVSSCNNLIKDIENDFNVKIKKLDNENNTLYHRLNRSDLVISGLPKGIANLENAIKNLCAFFSITIEQRDLQHVCYMHKKGSVLVKFCNVYTRDKLMAAYIKKRNLKLNDIDKSGITTRVYLNDHFGPHASRMNYICKQLLRIKKITKYKVYNADRPTVSVTFANGQQDSMNFEKCLEKLIPLMKD